MPVVTACATGWAIWNLKSRFIPAECIFYFSRLHFGDRVCCAWGRNWIFVCNLNEFFSCTLSNSDVKIPAQTHLSWHYQNVVIIPNPLDTKFETQRIYFSSSLSLSLSLTLSLSLARALSFAFSKIRVPINVPSFFPLAYLPLVYLYLKDERALLGTR